MKKWNKNKRAAFEMSITTIVILVIALTMLIFGMIFVRNIMCSGMDLLKGVTAGTKSQIDKLFSTQGGQVVCLGQVPTPQTVFAIGETQSVYCGFNVEKTKRFTITKGEVKQVVLPGVEQVPVNTWVSDLVQREVTANLNDQVIQPIVYMNVPKDAPEVTFTIKLTFTEEGTRNSFDRVLQYNVKRPSGIQNTIC